MGKDPAFLFYPGNWMKGTQLFTRAHKGAYMDLLMAQFNNGHLTLEDIQTVLGNDYDLMWESKLEPKFTIDDNGLYYNEFLESVVDDRNTYKQGRMNNLKGGKNSHKGTHKGKPHEKPMCSNASASKDTSSIKDKKEKYNPLDDCPFWKDKVVVEAFNSWQEVRTKKKCSNSDRAVRGYINTLMKLSKGNKEKAIAIFDYSADGGWTKLYEPAPKPQTNNNTSYRPELQEL